MAVNALGLPLLFQASPNQINDLLAGLQAGATVRGRVVELVGQDQAVVQLRGQNVVAQLPAQSGIQKADVLLLMVTQIQGAQSDKPASLSLRLLPNDAPAASPNVLGGNLATEDAQAAGLEQALGAAKLPLNAMTLRVAETLRQLGAALEPLALEQAVQATTALLANEQVASPQLPTPASQAPVQAALQQGVAELKVAAQFSPSSQTAVLLQQAVKTLEPLLQAPQAPVAADPSGPPAALATDGQAGQAAAALRQSVAALLNEPAPGALGDLQRLARQLAQPIEAAPRTAEAVAPSLSVPDGVSSSAPAPAGTRAALNEPTPLAAQPATQPGIDQAPSTVAAAPVPASGGVGYSALPAQREALAQLLAALPSGQPVSPASLRPLAETLVAQWKDPSSGPSLRLLASVAAQDPGAAPAATILETASGAVQRAVATLLQSPSSWPDKAAVREDLLSAGQPAPRADLSALPVENVAEAVAWLQARGLPPQRPLVETVATWISQDRNALDPATRGITQASTLPQDFLASKPDLAAAVGAAQAALDQSGLQPEIEGLAQRVQTWAQDQGLNLESQWAQAGPASSAGAPGSHGAAPAPAQAGLKPALLRLENELKAAVRDTRAADPAMSQRLESALKDVQSAVRSFNAVPLQAQTPPAYDTVHLPIPAWMNGQIGGGHLSVTWRQGRERGLDEKEPVNVAVALNTESLGTVKVLMQVWKGQASARVIGESDEAATFLAAGADELRQGFADRTPFKLLNLDFESGTEASAPSPYSGADAPGPTGLSLSA